MVFTKLLLIPPDLMNEPESTLIIGKRRTCKTSIVFRYCLKIAEQYPDQPVVYICGDKYDRMPLAVDGENHVSKDTMARITMNYPSSLNDLIDYLARFFTLDQFPCAFVVDDLDLILKTRAHSADRTYNQIISHVFALLVDNVEHCRSIGGKPCKLVVATAFDPENVENFVVIKELGEHFFDEIYTISPVDLLTSTSKCFNVTPKDDAYRLILQEQDDEIKMLSLIKKKPNKD